MKENRKLEFYGGDLVSFLPFLIFLLLIITFTFGFGSISDGALWLPPFIGLIIAFFFAKDKSYYSEVIIEGIAQKDAIIPIICWFWAGMFSRILRESGLAGGIAGLAASAGVSGSLFIVVSFIASAMFATASGTGFGTIAAGMGVLYPAGVALGAHPGLMAGAIISGGAFGDNLAPVSDTTICSATTQGVDVPGVVRSRLKYSIPAGTLTIALILIVGSIKNGPIGQTEIQAYNSSTLLMLIPVVLTIIIAIHTGDIIIATSIGIVLASLTGVLIGVFTPLAVDPINEDTLALIRIHGQGLDRTVDGVLYNGLSSMLQVVVLALLLFGSIEIMKRGRGTDLVLNALAKRIHGPKAAEAVISFMIIILSALMGLNAPAILAVGPSFAKPLSKKYGISPYRTANLLDAQSNILVYSLPWTPAIIYTVSFAQDSMAPLSPLDVGIYVFYSWSIFIVMMVSIFLGLGRKDGLEGKDITGRP